MGKYVWKDVLMVDGSGPQTIVIDLKPKITALDRGRNQIGQAITALLRLPEFREEAGDLIAQHADVVDLLRLYPSYCRWSVDDFRELDDIAPRENIPREPAQAFAALATVLGDLQRRWGMTQWSDGAQILVGALSRVRPDLVDLLGLGTVDFLPLKTLHFELRVRFCDQTLAEVEGEVREKVTIAVRNQYREKGYAERPGPAPRREVSIRNLEWYFLHAHGLSYLEVMMRWNKLHPKATPLDTLSERDRDLNLVKQGVLTIRRRYGS